ncbi:MAG TPA: hypothetical protein VNZ50_06965 [Hyphomicrobiaceae bacterium]|jgi:hypothetical protein|nr:hypothetical protein [Hyphomicrobiaceae bacterium]
MIRAATTALALLYFGLPSPSMAKGGPRTLSDVNTQNEVLVPAPSRDRYFNGLTNRMSSGQRRARHYFPGATRYPTIRLERATSE